MKISLLIISAVLTLTCCSNRTETRNEPETNEEQKVHHENDFPWTTDVTESAVEAIHRSIKNLKKPQDQREENFPANPFDMKFNQIEIEDFEIVGYSTSADQSDIYQIDFQPKDEIISGPRITVEINVKTKKPLRVYMSPDA